MNPLPRWIRLVGLLVLAVVPTLGQETLRLELAGSERTWADRSAEFPAYLRGLRTNRAAGGWNVELAVTNVPGAARRSDWIVVLEPSTNVVGIDRSTLSDSRRILGPFTGEPVAQTLRLVVDRGVPSLTARVYEALPESVRFTGRVLGSDGVPLETPASVEEIGPSSPAAVSTGRRGWFSTVSRPDVRGWRIAAPGHWPTFRPLESMPVGVADSIVLVPSNGPAATLDVFELPAPLPAGWTPLSAGAFPAGGFELGPGGTSELPEGMVVVRWDAERLAWEALGNPSRAPSVRGVLGTAAVLARVRPDAGPGAVTGVPVAEGALLPGNPAGVGVATVTASGRIEPSVRNASTNAVELQARGFVEFRSTNGPLASGTAFRCEIQESYQLRDGTRRVLPRWTTLVRAHRVDPADGTLLRGEFPLRPTQALGGEQLNEGLVRVEVLAERDDRLVEIPASGRTLEAGDVRVGIAAGTLPLGTVARIVPLDLADLGAVLPDGTPITAAFELELALGAPGAASPSVSLSGMAAGRRLVLARSVFDGSVAGYAPVLRLTTGSDGVASSAEPASGGLAGVDGGGQFVVVGVTGPQVVVRGTARNAAGSPVGGLIVRSGPWTALTGPDGRYELIAPAGSATTTVTVTDRATGDVAQGTVPAPTEGGVATVDVDLSPRGPFVVTTSPAAGAVGVTRVSPVVLAFSRPLNPGTVVVPGAVVLADATGAVLPAAVSINPAGDTVTLLPTVNLPASAALRVVVSTNLSDRFGRPLEGAREFGFTTEGDTLRRADAILTIFEPVDGAAGMSGGPGLADPESAVILVNETTGETATVLSKPDGSFTNRIPATVDDVLSAILVNRNGTRTTVPSARQEFRDGSVGLFASGGVIRRPFGSGELELEIPPGAIQGRSLFRIEARPVAELEAAMGSLVPADQRLVGALRFAVGGDPLRSSPRIRLPIPEGMREAFGAGLTNQEFLIVRRRVDEDGAFLEPVDFAKVKEGRLENSGTGVDFLPAGEFVGDAEAFASGPDASPVSKARRGRASVAKDLGGGLGRGFGFEDEFGLLQPISGRRYTPVHGFVLSNVASVPGSERRPVTRARVVGSGMTGNLATSTGPRGEFSTFDSGGGATVSARATSPDFPGQAAFGRASVVRDEDGSGVAGSLTLMFDRGEESLVDREDPRVSVSHSPGEPTVGETVTVRVQGNDDQRVASVELVVEQVSPLFSLQPVTASDIRLTAGPQVRAARGNLRRSFSLETPKPARIRLRATVRDSASKRATTVHTVVVGAPPVPRSGDDLTGPMVVSSSPFPGEDSFQPGRRIRLSFSEPVTGIPENLTAGDLFQLSPSGGIPTVEFAADRKSVELTWYELIPDRDYTLTVNPLLRDEAGNLFDQNPSNNPPPTDPPTANPAADPFQLPFRTSPQVPVTLRGVRDGGGVVALGNRLLVLDRAQAAGSSGSLHVYDPTLPDAPIQTAGVRPYPRSLQVLRSQTYPASSRAPGGTDDLVLVCGGRVLQSEPWMMVFAFKPDGSLVELLRQDVASERETTRSAFKVVAAPPLVGCLLIGGSTEVVAFDLFEAIRAQRIFGRLPNNPGTIGIPLGGRHVMTDDARGSRVRDFDIGMAGDRIALVGSPNGTTPPPAFETVIEEFGHSDPVPVDRETKRVFLALDQPVRTAQGEETHDFAILSQFPTGTDPNGRLLVLNLDDPERPEVVNAISIPIRHGTPQRILRREDGLLSLAGTEDVVLLDPTRLLSPTPADNGAHPALVGRLIGMGTHMPDFVSTSDGMVARAQGERTEVMGGAAWRGFSLFRPGVQGLPGTRVPDSLLENPAGLLLPVNDDDDDERTSGVDNPEHLQTASDRDDSIARANDGDLALIRLQPVPPVIRNRSVRRVELTLESRDAALPAVRLYSTDGSPLAGPSVAGGSVTHVGDLDDPSKPLSSLFREPKDLRIEGVAPCSDVTVRVRLLDSEGQALDSRTAHLTVLRLKITTVWSDQFTNRTFNLLPNHAGAESGRYMMMGTRDGAAHLKGTFVTDPPSVAMSYPPLFRLARENVPIARFVREAVAGRVPPPVEIEIGGLSSQADGQFALRLDSPANTNYVVLAGFDQDGDGDLSAGEVVSVFSDRGRTYLSGGLLAYPVSSPNIWSDDYHVKVVNQTVYELYRRALLTGAIGFEAVVPRAFASKTLMAFLTGLPLMVPTSFPNPIESIPAPRGPDFELRPDTKNPKYSHNTGVLWPEDGIARIPHYILDQTTAIPDLILRSGRFHQILNQEIAIHDRQIRAAVQNVGDVQTFEFRKTDGVEFGGGSGCLSIPNVDPSSPRFATALLEAFTACTDFDLFVGIGGADCDFTITVTFRGRLDPVTGTVVAVEEGPVRVQGKISDLYDWNFDNAFPDTFPATVQAGFGTLGEGGRIFFTEIPLDGEAGELGIVVR